MGRWLEALSDWDGTLPAILVASGVSPDQRRVLLTMLVARALDCELASIAIEHRAQAAPVLVQPADTGLFLSSASREDWAAVAVARAPVGVDVEGVDPAGEIPWNVLHPTEMDFLKALQGEVRARAFARLWSVKEAYVKARRAGLREAESFAVRFLDDENASISDPAATVVIAEARTRWWPDDARKVAVSVVLLRLSD
jgi:phosphopantetheinyl transferase